MGGYGTYNPYGAEVRQKPAFADKLIWLIIAMVALLASGMGLNAQTTAFFTDTESVTGNSIITARITLNAVPFTSFSFYNAVPGDILFRPITVSNAVSATNGGVTFPYYMTVSQDSGDSTMNSLNGFYSVAVRCYDQPAVTASVATGSSVDCASAAGTVKSVQLVSGVHGSASMYNIAAASPVASQISIEEPASFTGSGRLVIGSAATAGYVRGVRIQTKDNSAATGAYDFPSTAFGTPTQTTGGVRPGRVHRIGRLLHE